MNEIGTRRGSGGGVGRGSEEGRPVWPKCRHSALTVSVPPTPPLESSSTRPSLRHSRYSRVPRRLPLEGREPESTRRFQSEIVRSTPRPQSLSRPPRDHGQGCEFAAAFNRRSEVTIKLATQSAGEHGYYFGHHESGGAYENRAVLQSEGVCRFGSLTRKR